ncbi:Methionyl-tRNA synthetase [Pleurostoma richardsiae]|uniref:Probable methionine--tRNA ligase, mitochondrial n=1 Tax=Pleurostoma richardsiae TaxID=41990 RepID=A0AA38VE80_9PEZI|nr:Methionyl-tRNA synthetase [Pleurostoma richardsiae]
MGGSWLDKKPYYVTTPIFYVNASPHIGHMYSMVLADVLKRWQTLKGKKALLLTGTDEHGMKVQQAAAVEDVPPKQWCDINAEKFRDLARRTNIDNDFFMRTTDPDHADAVRHFWFLLKEKGYIYESKHQGWYCVSDETFYPESMLEKRVHPLTGKVHLASVESGNPVEWTEEKNYHFRMTALKDKLMAFYNENPDWILPAKRMNEVVSWVSNNLEDLSISRPVSRLSWGIPVPDDPSQTIYVWVDALINYLTKAGFPSWIPGREYEGGWPADVQVIGKDIVRFHGVYWPALLLALDIPPPRRLLSHAHWTLGGKKMSKSTGNVVNPYFALDRWGVDTMRFYMIHDGGISDDSDYGNIYIVERYRKCLQNGLGNLLGRITRPKLWNVREAVKSAARVSLAEDNWPDNIRSLFKRQRLTIDHAADSAYYHMESLNPSKALKCIMDAVFVTNKYLGLIKPWDVARLEKTPENELLLNESIYFASETLRVVGILLQPFMPDKAAELLDVLGVPPTHRTLKYARIGLDFDYGEPLRNPGKGAYDGLFPPLEVDT